MSAYSIASIADNYLKWGYRRKSFSQNQRVELVKGFPYRDLGISRTA